MQAEAHSNTLARQVGVTLAVLALYFLGQQIAAPGFRVEALPPGVPLTRASIVGLGLAPWIVGWLLVEVFSLLPGPGRKLRHGGWAGRLSLDRVSMVVGLVCALIQSMSYAVTVETLSSPFSAPLVPNPGWAFRVPFVLTLTAASAALFWLGTVITRWGIGHGFGLLLLADLLVRIWHGATSTGLDSTSPLHLGLDQILIQGLAALAFTAGFVLYLRSVEHGTARVRRAAADSGPQEAAAKSEGELELDEEWNEPAPGGPRWAVAFPQGLVAVLVTGWVLPILFGNESWRGILAATPIGATLAQMGTWLWIATQALLVVLFAWLFFRLFSGPRRLAAELPLTREEGARLEDELWNRFRVSTVLLVAGSAGLVAWSVYRPGPWAVSFEILRLGLLIAVPWDLASQWRFTQVHGALAPLCTLNNVHLAPELVSRLEEAGIPATLQGFRHRALFFSYLPLVQIGVLVPQDRLREAQARLAELDPKVV